MTRFIGKNTIGVSKDSQSRAAKIMKVLYDSYDKSLRFEGSKDFELFFEYSKRILKERWQKLKEVINEENGDFILHTNFFHKAYCNFSNESSETYPGTSICTLLSFVHQFIYLYIHIYSFTFIITHNLILFGFSGYI